MAKSFLRKKEQDQQELSLLFDQHTGKLKPGLRHENERIEIDMAADGFFGGCFMLSTGNSMIMHMFRTSHGSIDVKTMHISCQSDTYQPGRNYAGVIIYQYDGKSEWRTANNTHCKTGYIVIQDTDSDDVKKWIGKEPGAVHGAVYRNAFGESVSEVNVVGEGFALRNGKYELEKFEINSSVFNNPQGSMYHDDRRRMHELSEHCVRKVVEYWKTAGYSWVTQRNFEVTQLLEDFNTKLF